MPMDSSHKEAAPDDEAKVAYSKQSPDCEGFKDHGRPRRMTPLLYWKIRSGGIRDEVPGVTSARPLRADMQRIPRQVSYGSFAPVS
jgi:hypothetical protein